MRTEEVLAAIATGLWRWDNAAGTVTLDAEAARLLGLPAEPGSYREAAVRSRFHPVDWNEIYGVVNLAVAEGTLAEARLRIVDERGKVLRTVRSRSKPVVATDGDRENYVLIGTLQEVAEPQLGSSGPHTPITGDWRRSREAFLLDAGRALAEARSTEEVLRVAASLSMPGFSPDGLAVFGSAGERLTIIGHHGQSTAEEDPFTDMPLDTDYPAAEVVRTGRAIYLPPPRSTAAATPPPGRSPGASGGSPGRICRWSPPAARWAPGWPGSSTRWGSRPTSARCSPRSPGCSPRRWPGPGSRRPSGSSHSASSAR